MIQSGGNEGACFTLAQALKIAQPRSQLYMVVDTMCGCGIVTKMRHWSMVGHCQCVSFINLRKKIVIVTK